LPVRQREKNHIAVGRQRIEVRGTIGGSQRRGIDRETPQKASGSFIAPLQRRDFGVRVACQDDGEFARLRLWRRGFQRADAGTWANFPRKIEEFTAKNAKGT
jgi:hypothetical protein